MKIVITNGLGNAALHRCLGSLLQTTDSEDFDLHVFREREFREKTLNAALQQVGTTQDILFVGDDILFTPGWWEALKKYENAADIVGMCMLYPDGETVQDRGYDLVAEGERIFLEPRDRGLQRPPLAGFGVRECDAVCGCFFLVKQPVLARLGSFDEEGQNRWGEFLFMARARRAGFTTAVIDHALFHGGVGTKGNPDKRFSSMSYGVEKGLWEKIQKNYLDPGQVRKRREICLDEELTIRLERPSGKILCYGIGTVAELLINSLDIPSDLIDFCTGLPEEAGTHFHGHDVLDVAKIATEDYGWILMTPLYSGQKLAEKWILPRMTKAFAGIVSVMETGTSDTEKRFFCRDL